MKRGSLTLFTLVGLFTIGAAHAQPITASLEASRTSGVAPLAVHFDATDTVANSTNRPLHELDYSWNFGDDDDAVFETTGRSKNRAIGFVAGHLFETPKTYTVTLTVKDKNGNQQVKTQQVDVLDPDDFFAGSTVCISTGSISGSDGCPSGALKLANQASNNIEDLIEDQIDAGMRRILLEAETSWSTSGGETITLGKDREDTGHLGMFGSGDRPVIDCNTSGTCLIIKGDNWRVTDLYIDARGGGSKVIEGVPKLRRTLVHNCHLLGGDDHGFNFPADGEFPRPQENAMVENVIDKLNNGSRGRLFTLYGHRFIVLGNHAQTSAIDEHMFRSGTFYGSTFSDNYMIGRDHDKSTMKLHATVWSQHNEYSEKFMITHNIYDTDNSGAGGGIVVGPQNDDKDERLRDIIFDGNLHLAGPDTGDIIKSSGENVTIRNSIFNFRNERVDLAVHITRRDSSSQEPDPKNIHVYNNTVYGTSSGSLRAFEINSSASDSIVRNNLVYFPNSDDASVVKDRGDNSQVDHNLGYFPSDTGSCVSPTGGSTCLNPQFVDAAAGDFELLPNSPAIDAGFDLAGIVNRDFNGNERPVDVPNTGDSLWDIGALEFGAIGSNDNGVSLSVNDSSPQAGETLTLTLSGGDANKIFDLQILVGSNFITFHSGRLSSAGTGSFSLVVSGNVPSGTYSVRARTIKESESGNKVLVETASQLLSFN